MRLSLWLGALTALQLLAGLIGQLAVLRIIGVGSDSDAYIAAQAVPMVLSAVMSASFQNLWLPRFARVSEQPLILREEQAAAQGQTLMFLVGLSALLWAGSPWWSKVAFPGFSTAQLERVVTLGGPLFVAGVFTAQSSLLTAGMRATGRFLRAEVTTLFVTVTAIGLIFVVVPQYGIAAAPWIVLCRATCIYAVHLRQSGYPALRFKSNDATREIWRQVRPLMSASLLIKTNPLVDRYWSSRAGDGGVTLFNIAQLVISALSTVLERALLVPMAPNFSRHVHFGELTKLRLEYRRCLARVGGCVIGLAAALFLIRPIWNDTMQLALRLEPAAAQQIFLALLLLLPSIFAAVGGTAATSVLYAFGETRAATAIGIGGFAMSLLAKGMLFSMFGIAGLAAATSLYLLSTLSLYHLAVNRQIIRAQLKASNAH